jgi:uncharacterized protein with LGFP repeats
LARGTTYTVGVQTKNSDGTARSLVGATIQFTIKDKEYDAVSNDDTATVKKDVTSHIDAANGISSIVLDPEDTALVTPRDYWYSIHVLDADGARYKLDEGRIKIDGAPGNRVS